MLPASLVLLLNGLLCLAVLVVRGPEASLLIASLSSALIGFLGLLACGVRRLAAPR